MRFRSYRVGRPLSDLVENFWLCDGYVSPHLRERIFPSGTFELVFNLRDGDLRIYRARHPDRCTRLPGAVVSGPYGGYFVTDRAAEASLMAVHFKPGGAFPFLGLAANELLDTHVSLQDIWGAVRLRLANGYPPSAQMRVGFKSCRMHFCHVWFTDRNVIPPYCRRSSIFGTILRALLSESSPEKSDSAIVDLLMCLISRWVLSQNCLCESSDFSACCSRCTAFLWLTGQSWR
jgi:hypothetical protein